MDKFIRYIEAQGFAGTKEIQRRANVAEFSYKSFNPKITNKTLGRSTKHAENLFVFKLSASRAIRVNTKRRKVWLGNGKDMVKKFLNSI